jgi:hypothetical protein
VPRLPTAYVVAEDEGGDGHDVWRCLCPVDVASEISSMEEDVQ